MSPDERDHLCWLSGYLQNCAQAVQPLDRIRAKALYDESEWLFALAQRHKPAEGDTPPPECSICRRRHGSEVQHACE